MIKLVSLLQRDESFTRAEFVEHWRKTHVEYAEMIPELQRYATSVPVEEDAPYDGIAELWFDDIESMQSGFDSEAGQRAQADAEKFIAHSERILVETTVHFDR